MFAIAGIIKPTHFLETTEENFRNTLDVNGLGTPICQQESAKQMIKQGTGGKLIVTSSIAGRQGNPNFASYCASKFAVTALNQSAAHALSKHKITSNAFAPGVVDTPLRKKLDLDLVDMGDSSRPGEAIGRGTDLITLRYHRPVTVVDGVAPFYQRVRSRSLHGLISPCSV